MIYQGWKQVKKGSWQDSTCLLNYEWIFDVSAIKVVNIGIKNALYLIKKGIVIIKHCLIFLEVIYQGIIILLKWQYVMFVIGYKNSKERIDLLFINRKRYMDVLEYVPVGNIWSVEYNTNKSDIYQIPSERVFQLY